jgi:hypothetical protein
VTYFLHEEHDELRVLLYPESFTVNDVKLLLIKTSSPEFSEDKKTLSYERWFQVCQFINTSKMSANDLVRYKAICLRNIWEQVNKQELFESGDFKESKLFNQELRSLLQAILNSPTPEKKLGPFFHFIANFDLFSDLCFALDVELLVDLAEHSKDHFLFFNFAYIHAKRKSLVDGDARPLKKIMELLKNVERLTHEDSSKWRAMLTLLLSKKDSMFLNEYSRIFFPLYTLEVKEKFWNEFHHLLSTQPKNNLMNNFFVEYFKAMPIKHFYFNLPPFENRNAIEIEKFLASYAATSIPYTFHLLFSAFLHKKHPEKLNSDLAANLLGECNRLKVICYSFQKNLIDFENYLKKQEKVL